MIDKVADLAIRATEKIVAMTEETEKAAVEAVIWAGVETEKVDVMVTEVVTEVTMQTETTMEKPKVTKAEAATGKVVIWAEVETEKVAVEVVIWAEAVTEKAAEEAVTWAEVVTEMDRAKVTKANITKKVTRAEMLINLPKKTNDRLLN